MQKIIESLVACGISIGRLIESEDYAKLQATHKALLTEILWQRCFFQLHQNALSNVLRKLMQKQVAEDLLALHQTQTCTSIRMIFYTPS